MKKKVIALFVVIALCLSGCSTASNNVPSADDDVETSDTVDPTDTADTPDTTDEEEVTIADEEPMEEDSSASAPKELVEVSFAEFKSLDAIDESFVDALTDFSVNYFKNALDKENTVVSPLSLMIALQMVRMGSNGNTKAELDSLLNIDDDTLNANIKHMLEQASSSSDSNTKSLISNSFWVNNQLDIRLNNNYLDLLQRSFDATIQGISFDEAGKDKINNWIENNTEGLIKDFIDEIDNEGVFYLFNTIYFQDFWGSYLFSGKDRITKDDEFTNYDGQTVNVKMFNSSKQGNYYKGSNFLAFTDNPYDKLHRSDIIIIVPNEGEDVYEVAESLTPEIIADMLNTDSANMHHNAAITSCFPMFKYEDEVDLSEVLKNMGIHDLFDEEKADLSNAVVGSQNIYVEDGKQKISIDCNEKGITAVAVTSMQGGLGGAAVPPDEYITIRADRPFIYVLYKPIWENSKVQNIIYFMGAVYNLENVEPDEMIDVDGFKTGKYKLNYNMKVRSYPDINAPEAAVEAIPSEYRTEDKPVINKDTIVRFRDIRKNDNGSYWGEIDSGLWICIKDPNGTLYASYQE